MKRHILFLIAVLVGMSAMAQSSYDDAALDKKPIEIRGSKVYVGREKLDKSSAAACFSSVDGVDRSRDYLRYRAGYKAGLGLTIGGASLAVVGLGSAFAGFITALTKGFAGQNTLLPEIAMYLGAGSVVVGSACFVAGIPTICVYKKRLNRLERQYNASLEIGASSNGLSMAICF